MGSTASTAVAKTLLRAGVDPGGCRAAAKLAAGASLERLVHADRERGHGEKVRALAQRKLAATHTSLG